MVNLLQTARYFSIIHICVVISISPTTDFFYSTITCYSSHITTHTAGPTLLCEYKLSYLSCCYYRLTDWRMKAVVIAVVVVMEVVVLFMSFLCLPLPLAFPFLTILATKPFSFTTCSIFCCCCWRLCCWQSSVNQPPCTCCLCQPTTCTCCSNLLFNTMSLYSNKSPIITASADCISKNIL